MNMNMNMVIFNGDQAGGLHREMSRCSAPLMSVKDRALEACLVETLQLIACYGKPKTLVILTCERPTAH
jgi:hypothetical protein